MADARVDHTYVVCFADELQQEIVFIVHEARDASCQTNVIDYIDYFDHKDIR